MIFGPPDPPPTNRTLPFLSSTNDGDIEDKGRLKACNKMSWTYIYMYVKCYFYHAIVSKLKDNDDNEYSNQLECFQQNS